MGGKRLELPACRRGLGDTLVAVPAKNRTELQILALLDGRASLAGSRAAAIAPRRDLRLVEKSEAGKKKKGAFDVRNEATCSYTFSKGRATSRGCVPQVRQLARKRQTRLHVNGNEDGER